MTAPPGTGEVTIRVELPAHLRTLARVTGEVALPVTAGGDAGAVTLASVLDALESAYPALRGTMRDHQTGRRRPFVRFYACRQDLSHDSPDQPLPEPVRAGTEPLLVIGAMAGG
ncbi:MAG: MoaD/ThiS family protein [Streptosporangiaceae bacterium]